MSNTKCRKWRSFAAPLLIAALLALAACSDDGGGAAGVATLGGDDEAASASSNDEEVTPEEAEEAFREYAACMREHGIDMPDPEFTGIDGGGGGPVVQFRAGPQAGQRLGERDGDEFLAAQEACQPLIEGIVQNGQRNLDPEAEAEMRDKALAFAQCMREHGIDMPDPQFVDGGVINQIEPDVDFDSEEFEAAQEACGEELGFEGGVPGVRVRRVGD